MLFLAFGAACSGDQPAPSRATPEDAKAPSLGVRGSSPRDVGGVRIGIASTYARKVFPGDVSLELRALAASGGITTTDAHPAAADIEPI